MRLFQTAGALLLVGSAAPSAAALAQPPAPPPLADQLRDACRAVRTVDRRRLTADEAGAASYHERERTGSAAPPAGHRGPLIRLFVHHSSPPPSASWSLLAWKSGDGGWFVSRLVHAPAPGGGQPALAWPHEPGIDTTDLPGSDWTLAEGTLVPEDAARLEQLLDSRCLAREPPVRPLQLPLRSGLTLNCYWHPTSYHLELSDGGRSRPLLRQCNSYQNASAAEGRRWASDLVVDLLGRAPLAPAVPGAIPAPSAAPGEVPERFHGRWAQGVEQCTEPGRVRFDVSATGFAVNGRASAVDRIEQRGPRTLVLHGAGAGLVEGAPLERFAQPLLLSPDGTRLFVPDRFAGWHYLFHRCPAAP